MLNVGSLNDGVVLDHITAGKCMEVYHYLGLDKLDCQVAIIKNAKSEKMGRKDIIKIESPLDVVNLDILGYLDHNITVNIIHNGEISEKSHEAIRAQTIKMDSETHIFAFIELSLYICIVYIITIIIINKL